MPAALRSRVLLAVLFAADANVRAFWFLLGVKSHPARKTSTRRGVHRSLTAFTSATAYEFAGTLSVSRNVRALGLEDIPEEG